jgi:aspartyl aminopeptidase
MQAPSFVGFDNEMIAAHRLDNLTSAYAACEAICKAKPHSSVLQTAFFWDHEEIGSVSALGADSVFATHLLERIALSLKIDPEDLSRLKARSLCVSGDLAHGYHPNFSDKYDPQNAPFLGRGIVLKFNANQKYATSSSTATAILLLAEKHNIPIQKFASRSDIPSGSTVGSMMAAMTGIPTVDLGISSWAMHSIRETVSTKDELSLCDLFQKALEDDLIFPEDK